MFKKHHRSILVLIVLLFAIGAIFAIEQAVAIRNERSQMIEVCRSALSSDRPGYTSNQCGSTVIYSPLRYERMKSFLFSVTVYFDDGINQSWCHMQWLGSEWVVTGWGSTMAAPCPN